MGTRPLVKADPWEAVDAAARRLEPELRRQFLNAVAALREAMPLAALEELLETGALSAALEAAGVDLDLTGLSDVLRRGTVAGGTVNAATLGLSFELVNARAVRWAEQHAAGLVQAVNAETAEAIRRLVVNALREGRPPRVVARQIEQLVGLTVRHAAAVEKHWQGLLESGMSEAAAERAAGRMARRLLRRRAENIARTETLRAANQGQQLLWDEARNRGHIPEGMRKVWIVTTDDRLCALCAPLEGATVALGDSFVATEKATGWEFLSVRGGEDRVRVSGTAPLGRHVVSKVPPLHPSCFPGDTLVSPGGRVTGVSKRWYDGELVRVRVASEREFSCTPNHPILTPGGWVAAGLLVPGSHVVRSLGAKRIVGVDVDNGDVPSRIEEVVESFLRSGEVSAVPVPVAAPHFHGDGEGSEVAVVGSNRLLRNRGDASVGEHGSEGEFHVGGVVPPSALYRVGDGDQLVFRPLPPPRRFVCGRHLRGTFGLGHAGPFETSGVGSAAGGDASFAESAVDDASVYSETIGERLDRFTAGVAADEVIHVERYAFHGFVFNLETGSGFYAAESIVAHNCRCAVGLELSDLGVPDEPPAVAQSPLTAEMARLNEVPSFDNSRERSAWQQGYLKDALQDPDRRDAINTITTAARGWSGNPGPIRQGLNRALASGQPPTRGRLSGPISALYDIVGQMPETQRTLYRGIRVPGTGSERFMSLARETLRPGHRWDMPLSSFADTVEKARDFAATDVPGDALRVVYRTSGPTRAFHIDPFSGTTEREWLAGGRWETVSATESGGVWDVVIRFVSAIEKARRPGWLPAGWDPLPLLGLFPAFGEKLDT